MHVCSQMAQLFLTALFLTASNLLYSACVLHVVSGIRFSLDQRKTSGSHPRDTVVVFDTQWTPFMARLAYMLHTLTIFLDWRKSRCKFASGLDTLAFRPFVYSSSGIYAWKAIRDISATHRLVF
jgi:hypothetical protein